MNRFDRWYGWLMRRWAADPRCALRACRAPYRRGTGVGGYCSDACAAEHQSLTAW